MEKVSEFFMMLGSLEVPSFKHISPANRMWGRSVNCSDAGTWDPVRIAEVFWPTDREAILSIPLSSTGSSQNCRWYSGCLFLLQQAALGEGTSLNIARQWWTVIWKVKGPLPPQKKKRKGSSYLHGESTMMHYRQKGNYLKGLLVKQVAVPFVGRWKLLFMLYLPVLRPNHLETCWILGIHQTICWRNRNTSCDDGNIPENGSADILVIISGIMWMMWRERNWRQHGGWPWEPGEVVKSAVNLLLSSQGADKFGDGSQARLNTRDGGTQI